eukprot:751231-Hanusia_phi.AAC.2
MQQRRLLPPRAARASHAPFVSCILLPLAEEGGPEGVVEEVDEEEEGEEVEEAVVARHHDQNLQQRHRSCRSMPYDPQRADEEERDGDLDDEDHGDAELEEEGVQLSQVPCCRGRDRLRCEVVGERGELLPDAILGGDLNHATHEHELEEEEAKHPQRHARNLRAAARARAERSVHDREEAGLEQERVPLEVHEHVADRRQGQVEHAAREHDRSSAEADSSEGGEEEAEERESVAHEVLVDPQRLVPADQRRIQLPPQAPRELQLLRDGEDALAAVEALELDEVGREREHKHQPQPLQEDGSRLLVRRRSLLLVRGLRRRLPLPPQLLQQRS